MECHRVRDEVPDAIRRINQVRVGKVSVSRRGAMPVVPEKPADERQTFARHNHLTCRGVAQVMQAQATELRDLADRAPAGREAVRAPAFGVARKQNASGSPAPGSAAT